MTHVLRNLALGVAISCVCSVAWAQAPLKEDLPIPPAAKAVLDAFEKPLHPILGSVAPGGGVAFGIGYDTPRGQDWFHNASAKATFSQYWAVEAETGRQTDHSRIGVFASARNMNELDFFGVGSESARENRSNYRLRETSFGGRGWVRVFPALRVGGIVQFYAPDLGYGSDAANSIETVFAPADVPGFDAEPHFTRYRGYAQVAPHQGTYQLAVESVRDRDGGQFTFHRLELEGRQQFAGVKRGQRLTLHGLLGTTNQNAVVPYYLEYTLGGNSLGAFRPDTIGSDGTKATLRSFQNYRFRDRNLLLMQAEYRIPLQHSVEATVFYDAGQVAGRVSDLFTHIRQGTGFSLSYMRNGGAVVRMDVGYGGGEGPHVFWSFGGFGF